MNTELKNRTLYQVYRPESFKDVVGQEHVTDVLQSALKKNAVGHAYLFAGSRGVGKTTIARIFARELGCQPEDIYEIDGASHRKIEDVRSLRENVYTLPYRSPYKVYILDEVHMLTKEAFNALLKTLEEPPQHVIFMFATTEMEKLPDTIISRCQVFQLARPTEVHIAQHVAHIAKKEGLALDSSSAHLIALIADGSFRDALGVLQKVMHLSDDNKLDPKEIQRVTGAAPSQSVSDILSATATQNNGDVYKVLSTIYRSHINEKLVLLQLVSRVRNLLRARFDVDFRNEYFAGIPADEKQWYEAHLGIEGKELNARVLSTLLESLLQLRTARSPRLVLELALARILGNNDDALD